MKPEVRQNIFEQLKVDEGVLYHIYKDHLGHLTFGVGHLVLRGDPEYGLREGTPVSEERVMEAFEFDLNTAISDCHSLYGTIDFNSFPDEVQEILVNMAFNLGRYRLMQFVKMNQALKERDWKTAAKEGRDSLWYRQVPNRAERLMSRLENVS